MNKIDSFRGKNYYLSDFYERPVTYDGITYKNNEAAFQAQKCISYEDRKRFSDLNASEAKRLGRKVSLRPDWESIKVDVMTDIVHAKFEQNKDLAEKLCNTDTAFLDEGNTWGDRIWGTVNGNGKNLLGHILMSERDYLKGQMKYNDIEKSLDDMEYAFTVKGGGWGYIHKLFIIYKDGTVIMARKFDDSNILDYTEDFRFNYKNSRVDEDNVAISICNGKKTYLSSILNGKEPNFEEHSNVHFVCDAPTYTMYKITNGTVRELFSTEDVDSCKAMDYIETLCGVLRG